MPGGDTLHAQGVSDGGDDHGGLRLLGKILSFQTGVFRPVTCLRENKADPHPTYENQHSPSLLQTTLSSS